MSEIMVGDALYPLPAGILRAVIGLLPHVFPIGGSILQFPGDEGFPLPRHCKSDSGVRIQSIPYSFVVVVVFREFQRSGDFVLLNDILGVPEVPFRFPNVFSSGISFPLN